MVFFFSSHFISFFVPTLFIFFFGAFSFFTFCNTLPFALLNSDVNRHGLLFFLFDIFEESHDNINILLFFFSSVWFGVADKRDSLHIFRRKTSFLFFLLKRNRENTIHFSFLSPFFYESRSQALESENF